MDDEDAVRARLEEERARTAARVDALTRDFDEIVEAAQLVSADDEHDPDGSTVAFERAQVAALLLDAQQELTDIAGAFERLRVGSFGRCERCGRPIRPARLVARPTATTCVDCAP